MTLALCETINKRRGPRSRQQIRWWRQCAFGLQMLQNFVDNQLILDTGYHLGFSSALLADRHIDVEHSLQALRLGHGLVALIGCFVILRLR